MTAHYPPAPGGLPPQSALITDRAQLTAAYLLIPRGALRDIVASRLPHWEDTRLWVLARPQTGLAETFSQYLVEVDPGGGSDKPEPDPTAEAVLFVVSGRVEVGLADDRTLLAPGGYVFIPPGVAWTLRNTGAEPARFHWIRKAYQWVDGIPAPPVVVANEAEIAPVPMAGANGRWSTTRFVDADDVRYDMHVNIVTFEPGAVIPFAETHVMEHGLYVLEGKAIYRLNDQWVEVQEGDFMLLRAFCPQACYAGGPGRFRYLLYKDVNRHMALGSPFSGS